MSTMKETIALFRDATDAVGTRFATLADRLIAAEAGKATAEDLAERDAILATLNEMGKDPANPVPAPVESPTEPVV